MSCDSPARDLNSTKFSIAGNSSRVRCAIYSRDIIIRVYSVPRFTCKNSFVKISLWAKVMGLTEYFSRSNS